MLEANELFQLKRLKFYYRLIFTLFVLSLPFYIYNLYYDWFLFVAMTLFLPGLGILYLLPGRIPRRMCCRMLCAAVSGMILLLLGHHADQGMELRYIFVLIVPLLYYNLLGKDEGLIWALLYLIPISAMNIVTHLQYTDNGIPRKTVIFALMFFLSYLAVTVISYQIESSFQAVYNDLSRANSQLKTQHKKLLQAQREIRTLHSFMSMCMHCKRVKNEHSEFVDIGTYIQTHTDTDVSHALCPDCIQEFYPDIAEGVLTDAHAENSGSKQ